MKNIQTDCWDKVYIVGMLFLTSLIAFGTIVIALEAPKIRGGLQNISRGSCPIPHVIYGTVWSNGTPAPNVGITITNINTGDSDQLYSDNGGKYVQGVGNFPNCWVGGDRIQIKSCISERCSTKEVIFSLEGGGMRVDLDI